MKSCIRTGLVLIAGFVAAGARAADTNVTMKTVTNIEYSVDGGYTGAVVTNHVEDRPDWITAQAKLVITARMQGKNKQMIAMVNGQLVKEGDVATVVSGGKTYQWKLKTLTKTSADWEPVGVKDAH